MKKKEKYCKCGCALFVHDEDTSKCYSCGCETFEEKIQALRSKKNMGE